MFAEDRTLRCVVEKWFGRTSTEPVQMSRVPHIMPKRNRCIRVSLPGRAQAIAIFFFRHDDGSWSVVPPTSQPRDLPD
ncbi:hypothetical protein CIW54_22030 [Paraburkholderia sp. T12-10]|nr:hypothetical protein CIW54_22030 [Paraburkholderia sp. T12-10]